MKIFRRIKYDKELTVYEEDTYIFDCEKAVEAKLGWVSIGIIAIIASVIVDLVNIGQLMQLAFDVKSDLNFLDDPVKWSMPWITAVSLTVAYLICGVYSGSFLKDYLAKRRQKTLTFFIVSLIVMIIFVVIITVFRANSEWIRVQGNTESLNYNPYILTAVYTGMMLIGAFVALAYGMNKNDPVAEEIAFQARTHLPSDQLVFDRVYKEYIVKNYDELEWEAQERIYDRELSKHTFNINKLINRTRMIKDPSQANEIIDLAKKVQSSVLFNE